jgi:hypothetical protein
LKNAPSSCLFLNHPLPLSQFQFVAAAEQAMGANLSWRRSRPMARRSVFVPRSELEEAGADGEELRVRPPIRAGGSGCGRVTGSGGDRTGSRRGVGVGR